MPSSLSLDNGETAPDYHGPTAVLSIACDRVGSIVGCSDIIGRVTIVNIHYNVVYDRFVKPPHRTVINDYRTEVTGIRHKHLTERGVDLEEIRRDLSFFLPNRILVGHELKDDLQALNIPHDDLKQRDANLCKGFRNDPDTPRSLVDIVQEFTEMQIDYGPAHSKQVAVATMKLFDMFRWDVQDQYVDKSRFRTKRGKRRDDFHQHIKELQKRQTEYFRF